MYRHTHIYMRGKKCRVEFFITVDFHESQGPKRFLYGVLTAFL